jgi:hypothetical protein
MISPKVNICGIAKESLPLAKHFKHEKNRTPIPVYIDH